MVWRVAAATVAGEARSEAAITAQSGAPESVSGAHVCHRIGFPLE